MSTSAEETRRRLHLRHDDPQPTPVIIKLGSDGGGGAPLAENQHIRIVSDFMAFTDPTGTSWTEARSTKPGRILSLTLRDGGLHTLYCAVFPQDNVLTSLQLSYERPGGPEVLTLSEAMVDGQVLLSINSSLAAFDVVVKWPTGGGGWRDSRASFSGGPVHAVFKQTVINSEQNNVSLEYTFNSANDFSLSLDFHPILG